MSIIISWVQTSGHCCWKLRVLKKGGVFALNDEMKPGMYGDMAGVCPKTPGYGDMRKYALLTLPKRHLAHTAGRHDDAWRVENVGGKKVSGTRYGLNEQWSYVKI